MYLETGSVFVYLYLCICVFVYLCICVFVFVYLCTCICLKPASRLHRSWSRSIQWENGTFSSQSPTRRSNHQHGQVVTDMYSSKPVGEWRSTLASLDLPRYEVSPSDHGDDDGDHHYWTCRVHILSSDNFWDYHFLTAAHHQKNHDYQQHPTRWPFPRSSRPWSPYCCRQTSRSRWSELWSESLGSATLVPSSLMHICQR